MTMTAGGWLIVRAARAAYWLAQRPELARPPEFMRDVLFPGIDVCTGLYSHSSLPRCGLSKGL
jgi:hypothetical protein